MFCPWTAPNRIPCPFSVLLSARKSPNRISPDRGKNGQISIIGGKIGRNGGIRTHDPLHPMQVLYHPNPGSQLYKISLLRRKSISGRLGIFNAFLVPAVTGVWQTKNQIWGWRTSQKPNLSRIHFKTRTDSKPGGARELWETSKSSPTGFPMNLGSIRAHGGILRHDVFRRLCKNFTGIFQLWQTR